MIDIIPFHQQDLSELYLLQPNGWPNLVPAFQRYLTQAFCHPVKVVENGSIVGVGTAIIFPGSAWLGHIIVREDCRGRGLGLLITKHLMTLATHCSTISLIATDLGKPVYIKAGFKPELQYVFMQCTEKVDAKPTARFVNQPQPSEFAAMYDFDTVCSGEQRQNLLQSHATDALLYSSGSEIEGIYWTTLGEGLICALNPQAGLALSAFRLAHLPQVVIPENNTATIQFYQQLGFKEIRRAWRMYWGRPLTWKPEYMYSRIGGNLG